VIGGTVTAGIAVILLALLVWRTIPDRSADREHRAGLAAQSAGLALPADLVDWVSGREREQGLVRLLALGPVVPPLAFWYGYAAVRSWDHGSGTPVPPLLAIWIFVPVSAACDLAWRLTAIHRARAGGNCWRAGDPTRHVAAFLNPAWTWLARAVVVILAAVTIGAVAARPPASASGLWPAAAAALVSVAGLFAAEIAQRRVVRGTRLGSSEAALAFDEASLRRTVGDLAMAGVAIAVLATVIADWPLASATGGSLLTQSVFPLLWVLTAGWVTATAAISRQRRREPPLPPAVADESQQTGYGYTWW
jgi:hypothetical protein